MEAGREAAGAELEEQPGQGLESRPDGAELVEQWGGARYDWS